MTSPLRRRAFLKLSATTAAALAIGPRDLSRLGAAEPGRPPAPECSTPTAAKLGWELCAQLYTFRRFSFYEALEKISALGFRHVEPCFFLALDGARPELKTGESLPAPVRRELKEKLAKRGIAMTHFYADLGTDLVAARKVFDFAQEMGVKTIVSEPPPEAFDGIEKLCDEYEICLAVHNHPQGPGSRYWNPEEVLKVVKSRGKRVGACCDTGHWVRSGLHPVDCLKKMEGKILTLHLKDVAEWGKPEARDVPLGTGKADYGAVLKELRRQGFRGVMAIEYEHDSEKLVEEVAACLEFVERTAKTAR